MEDEQTKSQLDAGTGVGLGVALGICFGAALGPVFGQCRRSAPDCSETNDE